MKAKFILISMLTALFFSVKSQQIGQLPNDTFQNWTFSQYAPDYWCTLSSLADFNTGLSYKDVNSADAYYGGVAVGLISDSLVVAPEEGVVGGILSLGSGSINTGTTPPTVSFSGMPFSYRPDTVYAIYLYSTPGADAPDASIFMTASVADTTIDTTITGGQDSIITITSTTINTRNVVIIDTVVTAVNDTTINGVDTSVTTEYHTTYDTISIAVNDTTFLIRDSIITTATDTSISVVASVGVDTIIAAAAYLPVPVNGTTFTLGVLPITGLYLDPVNNPDTLLLQFSSSWQTILDTSITTTDSVTTNNDTIPINDTSITIAQGPVKGSTLILSQVFFGYVTLPTGLQQVADKMGFMLYPNPANNVINISSMDNADGYKFLISDMKGSLVYGGALYGNRTSIALGTFAAGMYLYRIADAQGNILKQDKFIVTK